ncbi:MAG: hypothetical protein LVQ97_04665 [Candidatus Micrarchaeales archaeon]|jgi:hypothetical protein|uniref:Uncharacterized protein n=1 Tax=Candidatus Micrarchaeum acidiphilum ARMAN-2 TaxID=425595 RepID=C7DGZ2_MICA2|nr:MAG: hypothetical protein UNLARM2_0338 [Candidatus Micrarchaeum acidiphilum ARMAN-2]MCW6161450.1 hypothetical protein [Candidatus Micrarchaeales archaeon]
MDKENVRKNTDIKLRGEQTEKKVIDTDSETELRLYFNEEEGHVIAYPEVVISARQRAGYDSATDTFNKTTKISINFYGGSGAREEYGAEIVIEKDGGLTAEALPSGYRGYDADTYRVDSKIVYSEDGLYLVPLTDKESKLGAQAPKILISKKGITVGDKFISMNSILPSI